MVRTNRIVGAISILLQRECFTTTTTVVLLQTPWQLSHREQTTIASTTAGGVHRTMVPARNTAVVVRGQRLFVVLCCLAVLGLGVLGRVEAAKNDNDDDNNLGLMAKACANYCSSGVNGLDLWVSLEEVSEQP